MESHAHEHLRTPESPGDGPVRGMRRRDAERGRLRIVLAITGVFLLVEAVAGILADSLALLADAGHMFTDVGALGLSLIAMRFAQRPAGPEKTYGYVRMEILAALVNGAALLVMSCFIVWEAWERFQAPRQVDGPIMLVVAVVGLVVNVAGALLLHGHSHGSLNLRGAYLHVLGDLLGSLGAIAAGLVILFTGWMPADPLISVLIALLILASAWRLVKEATDVLLESAPSYIDVEDVMDELSEIDGLHDVHDLHVWTLTSGFVALSGHGVVEDPKEQGRILEEIGARMEDRGIGHVTFQLEPRPLYRISGTEGDHGDSSA